VQTLAAVGGLRIVTFTFRMESNVMDRAALSVLPGGRSEGQPKQEGFIQVFSSLVTTKELSNGAFRLYCMLTNYCWSGKNECNPAVSTLAELLGVGEATIRRWMSELEGFDLVAIRSDRNGGSNHYKLSRVVKAGDYVGSRTINYDHPGTPSDSKIGRSGRSKLIPESHDLNIPIETYTTQEAVCDGPSPEDDPWDKEVINDESPPLSAPSPDKREEEFTELLRAARVAPKAVKSLVWAAINAGRDADYIRRVITSSLKKDNPPGWVAFMINSNAEPPLLGSPAVPGVKRDFFVGLGNFAQVVEQTRLSKWAAVIDHDESEAEE
jgi:hypothetical protein